MGIVLKSLCAESLFVFNLSFRFDYLIFLSLFWLCPFLENQIFWFGFVFRLFWVFFILVTLECRWHNVIISILMKSVPLSVTRISGNLNFAIQC